MRINQSNITASNWRARAETPSNQSASAQENVQKMLEISASKRLKADDPNSHAISEGISRSTSDTDKSITKKTNSTYSLVNALPRSTNLQTLYPYQKASDQRNESSQTMGYAGRVNSRLTQDAINTYRNHQFLDKREEIVSSFGVNEFA